MASAASSLTAVTAALASAVTSSIIANNEALDTIDMAAAVDASTMASVAAAVGVDETLEEIIANDAFVNVDSNNIGIDGHFDASLAPRRVLLSNNEVSLVLRFTLGGFVRPFLMTCIFAFV